MKRGDYTHLQYQKCVIPELMGKSVNQQLFEQFMPHDGAPLKRSQPFNHLLENSAEYAQEREELKNEMSHQTKR
jgi:hypothetical protein